MDRSSPDLVRIVQCPVQWVVFLVSLHRNGVKQIFTFPRENLILDKFLTLVNTL